MASDFQYDKVARVFAATDVDGDGYLTEATATAAFALLDLNRDGFLSRSEFAEHWTEFWAGDNPAAPGSWVFGVFPASAGHR
jgi:Ca2+-binding EF-hand superfamily protein